MPEETGLDTSIPLIGWQDSGRESEVPTPKQRGRKRKEPSDKPSSPPPRGEPAEGVGTKIDVVV